MNDGYDNIFNSSSAEDSTFEHATLIATLAERFSFSENHYKCILRRTRHNGRTPTWEW